MRRGAGFVRKSCGLQDILSLGQDLGSKDWRERFSRYEFDSSSQALFEKISESKEVV